MQDGILAAAGVDVQLFHQALVNGKLTQPEIDLQCFLISHSLKYNFYPIIIIDFILAREAAETQGLAQEQQQANSYAIIQVLPNFHDLFNWRGCLMRKGW